MSTSDTPSTMSPTRRPLASQTTTREEVLASDGGRPNRGVAKLGDQMIILLDLNYLFAVAGDGAIAAFAA
jgi:hypothetical protein